MKKSNPQPQVIVKALAVKESIPAAWIAAVALITLYTLVIL